MTTIRLGLLHTVADLAGRFQQLAGELSPGCRLVHVADPDLLASAIDSGITPELTRRVGRHAGYLAGLGVDAVLVTCSSIGECADAVAAELSVPVLRVDRPMAREAVALAAAGTGRVAVLATVRSTLEPTRRLVENVARAAGPSIRIDAALIDGAASARAAGDLARHDDLVRVAVAEAADRSDVVVLAQASMADAVSGPLLGDVRVLSSPRSGLRAALDSVTE